MAAYLATRAAAMQPYLGSLDAVDFALGLRDFDLARYQPHFPGYPLYMALACSIHRLGAPSPAALELPAVALGIPALVAFYRAAARSLGQARGQLAALLWVACPGLCLAAGQPSSDALGVAVFTAVLSALALGWRHLGDASRPRGWLVAGGLGFGFGVALGVRLGYAPLLVGAFVLVAYAAGAGRAGGALRAVLACTLGCAAGVLAWLLPMLVVVGPAELWRVASRSVAGHFGSWGGALSAPSAPRLGPRLGLFAAAVLEHGLGWGRSVVGVALSAAWLGGLALFVAEARRAGSAARRVLPWLLLLGLPYGVWMVVAQNPEKPRHVLPLLPLGLIGLAAGLSLGRGPRATRLSSALVAATLVLGMSWTAWGRGLAARAEPSASFQLVSYVASTVPAEGTVFYGGEEVRLFAYYAPWVRAKRAPDLSLVVADLRGGLGPRRIYVSSKVGSLPAALLTRVRTFARDPLLDPHYARLDLYTLDARALRARRERDEP